MDTANLFIVSAPKCGTSSLARSLADHPDAHLPFVKEPNWFGSDLAPAVADYARLYAKGRGRRVRIDASTLYLWSRDAIAEIVRAVPDARFIALFRDPAEAVPAYHAQLLRHEAEPCADFATAWAEQEARMAGHAAGPVYADFFAYGTQAVRALRDAPEGGSGSTPSAGWSASRRRCCGRYRSSPGSSRLT